MLLKNLRVHIAAIPDTSISVADKSFNTLSLVERFVQGSHAAFKFRAIANVITNNLTALHVCIECQVTKAFNGPDVSDIAYPNLVRSGSF